MLNANPTAFSAILDKIEYKFGSLLNYLEDCITLNAQMRNILKERYLEDL